MTHLENLGPAIAKPSVPDHQAFFVVTKLAGYGLHAERATTRHHHYCSGVVGYLECGRDIVHHLLERLRHMIERPVSKNNRVF